MNKSIELLLARLERQPEELGRWEHLFNQYKKYMTEDDKKAFWEKICEIRMGDFDEKVLQTLLADKEEKERKKLSAIEEIVERGLNEAFKEAYTQHTLDTFTYLTKGRQIFKDEK